MEEDGNGRGRSEHFWILGLATAAILGSCLFEPYDEGGLKLALPGISAPVLLPDTCMSRRVLGISCPGCGLTRSFASTAHGDLERAFGHNLMGPILFAFCVLQIPYRLIAYLNPASCRGFVRLVERRADLIAWAVVFGLMISWGATRLLEESWLKLFSM
jgi:hypothetical protein